MGIYQEIYIKKLEEKQEIINFTAWMQGMYNMASIQATMGKHARYPQKPYPMQGESEGLSGEEQFLLWIESFNRSCGGMEEEVME